jgi:hypothetical protein
VSCSRSQSVGSPRATFLRIGLVLSAVLHLSAAVTGRAAQADEPSAPAAKLIPGVRVNIELQSGKKLKGVTIEKIRPGKIPGTVANLRVTEGDSGIATLLGAAAIRQVSGLDGTPYLVFDEPSKSLVPPDDARLEAIHRAAAAQGEAAAGQAAARKNGHAAKDHRAKRGAETPAEEEARRKANEAKRQEYFKQTGVWLWPEVTDKDWEDGVAKQKAFLRQVYEKFPTLHLKLYETQHFLFLSDLPPQWVNVYTSCLDAMHDQLCTAYGVKDKDRVWLGKLPVVAFSSSASFEECEKEFFDHPIDGKVFQGLAHKAMNGEVAVTCHCGKDPYYFAAVLVHETTHGFTHRYKSAVLLPSWLDEGIADWVAMNVVHKNNSVLSKVQAGLAQAKQRGNLGGNFFADGKKIQPWQYGVATSMVNFLLKSNPKNFRKMLDAIKLGTKWQDALADAYGVTPAELTVAFGRSVGIPNLQP